MLVQVPLRFRSTALGNVANLIPGPSPAQLAVLALMLALPALAVLRAHAVRRRG